MRLAFLVNHDAAAGLALALLAPALVGNEFRVLYTDRPARSGGPLAELAAFDRGRLAELAIFEALDAEQADDINGRDFERFRAWQPELAISIRHMSILAPPVIAVPRHGVLNLHSGHLPAYQGVMATFWAMSRGERDIGTTLHRIESAEIDRGEVLVRTRERTRFDRSYFWNVLNLYRAGCREIVAAVRALAQTGRVVSRPQEGAGTYYSFPTTADLDAFPYPLFAPNDTLRSFL